MASGRVVYSNPNNMSVMLQSEGLSSSSSSSPVLESLWVNSSDPTFHGSSSMYCFQDGRQTAAMDAPFFQQQLIKEESCGGSGGGDDYDDFLHQPEKKRRLTAEQVQSLERSFEGEHKLEPERKVQLAKELGLQPRQVAIWFQNRRARSKTKQLERDYGSLKARFDTLKADHENLLKEKEHLASEVLLLTDKLQVRERDSGHSSEPQKPISSPHGEPAENPIPHGNSVTVFNHQDAISCSLLEPTDSSYGIEQEHSDFSQDEEDQSRFPLSPSFPRLEFVDYNSCHDTVPPPNSCNFGFTVDDQPFCFWPY